MRLRDGKRPGGGRDRLGRGGAVDVAAGEGEEGGDGDQEQPGDGDKPLDRAAGSGHEGHLHFG